jgi:hypothetical protein
VKSHDELLQLLGPGTARSDAVTGLFRFPNLAHVRAAMHAAGYQFLEDLPPDQRVPRTDPEPGHEQLSLTRAALNSAVRDREALFRSAGYPPKVFISYRWESVEIRQWTARVARYVQDRGFTVYLDQDVAALRDNDPIELGRYLSVIVDCRIVLCVVTPQYVAGLEPRAWLTEERQLMNLLARRGATVVHVLRDGDPPPQPVRNAFSGPFDVTRGVSVEALVPDHHAFSVDMRGSRADDFARLDPYFTYDGPRLSAEAESALRPWLDRVARAYDAGAAALTENDLREGAPFTGTTEFQRLAARFAARACARATAVRLARAAANAQASAETLIDTARLLRDLDEPGSALDAVTQLPWWLSADWSWGVHFLQGDILDDLGSHVAALAHLTYAIALTDRSGFERKPTPTEIAVLHGTLGYVLLFRFAEPALALDHLRAAWRCRPTAENAGNLIACHAGLDDWASAQEVWSAAARDLLAADRNRFEVLRAGVATRTLRPPGATVRRPGADAAWNCPACSVQLEMGQRDLLCASCGTAFRDVTRCPCCGRNELAGAGAATRVPILPPKCPICRSGVPMRPAS